MLCRLLCLTALAAPFPAAAQLCDGTTGPIAADGRVFGHLPYGDAAPDELVEAPEGFGIGRQCIVRRDLVPDLTRLLAAAAQDAAVMGTLRGLSCHRSIARQSDVFCRETPTGDAADRAISVAPPGHSEHATGYAIDFAIRPSSGCPDAEACMAATPAFRWLVVNAPKYGFEMSFPVSNRQNVKWEPWHWRWVGVTASEPGAAKARGRFARARRDFPAEPSITEPVVIRFVQQAPAVDIIVPPPATDKKKRKRRR